MITRHGELLEWLLAGLKQVPFLAGCRKMGVLHDLGREALLGYFDSDLSIGAFASGGSYNEEVELRGQTEDTDVVIVIGSRNLIAPEASLGAGDEPGCWDVLEAVRQCYSGWTRDQETGDRKQEAGNISTIIPRRWRALYSEDGVAILGLELRVTLFRAVPQGHMDSFGAGYPARGQKTEDG